MAASTRARVRSLTRGLSLSTRDTVPAPTPACAATSAMVTTTPLFRVSPWNRFQIGWRERTSRPTKCQWNRFHEPVSARSVDKPTRRLGSRRTGGGCGGQRLPPEPPTVARSGSAGRATGERRPARRRPTLDPEAPLRDRLHQVVHEPL